MSLTRWRWILILLAGFLVLGIMSLLIWEGNFHSDAALRIREDYAQKLRQEDEKEKKGFLKKLEAPVTPPQTDLSQVSTQGEKRGWPSLSTLPENNLQEDLKKHVGPVEVDLTPEERKLIPLERSSAPVFEEPPIPHSLLDQTPPSRLTSEKKNLPVTPRRYRFNNLSPEALSGNGVVTQDHTSQEFNLDTFAPELEDIDLALLDHINSSTLELDIAAGVWTPFYFQGNRLLEVGDKLRGQVTPGRQRNRLIVKFTKIIKKDGRSMPIQGVSLAEDGTLGIPGEKVGNLFQVAAGPLLAELLKAVSETFQDRQQAVLGNSTVLTTLPAENMKNAGLRGSQRVLEKIEILMMEELEENKPYLFVRAGTRLRCRLQSSVDFSQVDYGK